LLSSDEKVKHSCPRFSFEGLKITSDATCYVSLHYRNNYLYRRKESHSISVILLVSTMCPSGHYCTLQLIFRSLHVQRDAQTCYIM